MAPVMRIRNEDNCDLTKDIKFRSHRSGADDLLDRHHLGWVGPVVLLTVTALLVVLLLYGHIPYLVP